MLARGVATNLPSPATLPRTKRWWWFFAFSRRIHIGMWRFIDRVGYVVLKNRRCELRPRPHRTEGTAQNKEPLNVSIDGGSHPDGATWCLQMFPPPSTATPLVCHSNHRRQRHLKLSTNIALLDVLAIKTFPATSNGNPDSWMEVRGPKTAYDVVIALWSVSAG